MYEKIAVFSSWLDNRTKLVGDGLAATGNANILLSTTNHIKEGGKYEYIFLKKVPLSA